VRVIGVLIGVVVWRSRWIDSRLAVDEMSVVAYQGVLAKSCFLGALVTEFVPVIIARMIHSAVRFNVGIEAHRPVEAGEGVLSGRSGVL